MSSAGGSMRDLYQVLEGWDVIRSLDFAYFGGLRLSNRGMTRWSDTSGRLISKLQNLIDYTIYYFRKKAIAYKFYKANDFNEYDIIVPPPHANLDIYPSHLRSHRKLVRHNYSSPSSEKPEVLRHFEILDKLDMIPPREYSIHCEYD